MRDLHLVRRYFLQQLLQERHSADPRVAGRSEKLFEDAERGANATLSIDLENQEIHGPDGGVVKFEIDHFRKHCLLNGLDDIGLTKQKADKIAGYEKKQAEARPWA